jgi:hypothetical protein
MPYALEEWSRWADPTGKNNEVFLNSFTEISGRIAATRASIKRDRIRDPNEIARLLLPLDRMLEDWGLGLPDSWQLKSYRLLDGSTMSAAVYEDQYHTYEGLWVASTWNNLRMMRMTMHETILVAQRNLGSEMDHESTLHSTRILAGLADDICYSVPYMLGHRPGGPIFGAPGHSGKEEEANKLPAPGGYLLLWPLFQAGSSTAVTYDQKRWIANLLHGIGSSMGVQLATSMAGRVEDWNFSYAQNMSWLLGDFYPHE